MQIVKDVRAPFLTALLAWIAYRVRQTLTAMKPEYETSAVAILVAGSGNPSGV